MFDSLRGAYRVRSNSTGAQNDYATHFTSLNENGFTVADGDALNDNGGTYVAYGWKAGDHDDSLPEINDNGSIDSVVSVNDAAGFSIVKYTGTGANATVGHGLSSAPDMIFIKNLDQADDWAVFNTTVGASNYMNLNQNYTASGSGTIFGSTPTLLQVQLYLA